MYGQSCHENVLMLLAIADNHEIKNILENGNELSIIISVFVWRIISCESVFAILGIQIDLKQKRQ